MAIAILGAVSGCATGPDRNPADPLEPVNRVTYRFNDALDRTIAKPIAERYNEYMPRPIRTAIGNFFSNLGDVPVMLNNFVQLRGADGFSDLMRIAVNTTFGIAGLLDIATPAGLEKHDQDFGLTLGRYGVPAGPYLVMPIFGPSTFRDTAGFAVDQYAYPPNYAKPVVRNSMWGTNFVSTRARYLTATTLLEEAALDKYTFTRDAYLGRRRYQLNEGKEESVPSYDGETTPAGQGTGNGGTPPAAQPGGNADKAPAGQPAGKAGTKAAPAGRPAGDAGTAPAGQPAGNAGKPPAGQPADKTGNPPPGQ